ncbi:MAG: type VI secretion system ATPase TssH [Deltaproteobacteria bacterium]|nr:type VI secretion system ATPase TssH [Deltaproteobacteria bacterium]
MSFDIRALYNKLNFCCRNSLEDAVANAVQRESYEVTPEDFLLCLCNNNNCDLSLIISNFSLDMGQFTAELQEELEKTNTGNSGKPVFSPLLINLLKDSWLVASIDLSEDLISSFSILIAIKRFSQYKLSGFAGFFDSVSEDEILKSLSKIRDFSIETTLRDPDSSEVESGKKELGKETVLSKYTIDYTDNAAKDNFDPVFCRDEEIHQMMDVLSRRRKNNPILVGEPGVGKTAVIEGLAQKIAQGTVPDFFKDAKLLELDLVLLQTGAGVKGEFEKRIKNIITEIKSFERKIILFIDEAHGLIGAGGDEGKSDAANLIKPALARGELRVIGATTWSEYKKYFEKDKALARRFQLIKIEEPSVDDSITILRGLKEKYEEAHGVYVRDDAISAAVILSSKYISGRLLPDKAIDVLDTCCARVNLSTSKKPYDIEKKEKNIQMVKLEREAILRDLKVTGTTSEHSDKEIEDLNTKIKSLEVELKEVTDKWSGQKVIVDKLLAKRREFLKAGDKDSESQTSEDSLENLKDTDLDGEDLYPYEVSPDLVGNVISGWTGIPVGKLKKDDVSVVKSIHTHIEKIIKGQSQAIKKIGKILKTSKAGMGNPEAPLGVFLLTGPSGTGKTETAKTIADLMFGGDHALITVNMSEFQEKHTISRLIGSPPGYVGYGEGGVLTEAVRRNPYSVVLLDEVEKASVDVLNLFYQVFDKGALKDGEGVDIDFKNTVIFLTSNLGTSQIIEVYNEDANASMDDAKDLINEILSNHFKPALLARMEVVPFLPLGADVLKDIIKAKLSKIDERLMNNYNVEISYDEELVNFISSKCTDINSGARNIDHMIQNYILPEISSIVLDIEDTVDKQLIQLGVEDEELNCLLL